MEKERKEREQKEQEELKNKGKDAQIQDKKKEPIEKQEEKEREKQKELESLKRINYENHKDLNGVKYKLQYDKKKSKKDTDLDREALQELFNGLTYKKVFSIDELELIACSYKSQLKETRQGIKTIELLEGKSNFAKQKSTMLKYKYGLIFDMCQNGKDIID